MSKKLMLLAAGALAALAFTALPSAASALEAPLKCETGEPCTYHIHGLESKFSMTNGDTVKCTTVEGDGKLTNLDALKEATTGDVELTFTGCKEQNSGFQFSCSNTGTAGKITTNEMVTHNIWINGSTQGVLMTGANTTFTCAGGFASTQVTGNVIGDLEEPCGTTGTVFHMNFTASSHGIQTFTTYTTRTFTLEGKTSHTGGGSYVQAAQTGTGTLTFNQKVENTC